ncbi:MAG: MgtC/SapB family protein [Candidatus Tectomicrobia bacterium]|uniref:MgtC/SapB family protein n=1 Tax=Tectimicrobiota bacterium TaxID=2528274 RepID=A0A932CKX4_UNCTE|nr:MgtC/SapB family protein [Candidatus Tectomicrobia bacterium]
MLTNLEITLRLLLAALLGGMVGLERERKNQLAGFRTHIILCVGSALVMMISIYVAENADPSAQTDPSRIAAQVVSGVGFLGAGAILRLGGSVKGVTTAASIWTMAAIGLAVGAGFYYGAAMATGIILLALAILGKIESSLLLGKRERNFTLTVVDTPGILGKVESALHPHNISLTNIRINKNGLANRLEIQATIEIPKGADLAQVSNSLASIGEVLEVEIL